MGKIKKIAFIKMGSFSNTNKSVLNLLKREFPDYEIDVIDIFEEIVEIKTFVNLFHAIKEHGLKVFYSGKNFFTSLIYNEYIFKLVKKRITLHLKGSDYNFTFQTQSLFDTSIDGIPNFVYTDHTAKATALYPDFDPKKESYSDLWYDCEKTIYQNATINFTMSEDISRSIVEQYGCDPDKVVCAHVAPNADISQVLRNKKDRFEHPHILFVGKNWKPKGGPTLLKAFVRISKIHPDVKLTIVGCTPEINIANCNVVGKVPVSKVGNYFSDASIFCLPTLREAFGIVFLEAMAYGLPVIGTNIGAIPEFIIKDKNGYVIEPTNVDELTTRLLQLIESPPKCEKFGLFGNKLFLEKYTWEKVGKIMRRNIRHYI